MSSGGGGGEGGSADEEIRRKHTELSSSSSASASAILQSPRHVALDASQIESKETIDAFIAKNRARLIIEEEESNSADDIDSKIEEILVLNSSVSLPLKFQQDSLNDSFVEMPTRTRQHLTQFEQPDSLEPPSSKKLKENSEHAKKLAKRHSSGMKRSKSDALAENLRNASILKKKTSSILDGWLHYRKRIRWKKAYFELQQRHLVYSSSSTATTTKLDLLKASVSSYSEYLLNNSSRSSIISSSGGNQTLSNTVTSRNSRSSGVSTPKSSSDQGCIFVLTLANFCVFFLRAPNEAIRNLWMKEIGMRCLDLLKAVSPQFEETRRVKISLEGLQYDYGNESMTYQLEVHLADGEMVWFLMKTQSEMEQISNSALEILKKNHADLSSLPDFPIPSLEEAENGKLQEKMNNFIVALSLFPIVTDDMEFLSFIGIGSRPSDPKGGNRAFKDHVYRPKMQVQRAQEMLETGDLLLFRHPSMLSVGQRILLQSEFDHVGLVVHYPVSSTSRQSLYVLEAVNSGVTMIPIMEKLFAYADEGMVVLRKLSWTWTREKKDILQGFIDRVVGKPYSIMGFLGKTTDEKYFCSQLIAEAFQILGILPSDKHAGEYLPQSFSSGAPVKMQLLDGAELGEEEFLLTFEKREIMNALRTSGKISKI